MSVVADKTGSLIATSGRFGALLSGAGEPAVEVMTRFGERIGVAFQLSDDLLDVASDSAVSGKMPGTDLREGVPTLPVLHVRRANDPADARLLELLEADLEDDALHKEALGLLRDNAAMDAARADLRRWADDARSRPEPAAARPGTGGPGVAVRRGGQPHRLTRHGFPRRIVCLPLGMPRRPSRAQVSWAIVMVAVMVVGIAAWLIGAGRDPGDAATESGARRTRRCSTTAPTTSAPPRTCATAAHNFEPQTISVPGVAEARLRGHPAAR